MAAPFRAGDRAVFLDEDPAGVRVKQTLVLSVRADGDSWSVRTLDGEELVNERGEGRQLVPMGAEIEALIEQRGTSFVVSDERSEASHQARPHGFDREHQRRRELDVERRQDRER